jgi:hypothetical protein
MANEKDQQEQAIFLDIADDTGVIATHPEDIEFRHAVATSHEGDNTRNTIKPFLIAVGCSLVPDRHFQFDSSFVTPDAKPGMIRLARLFEDLTDPTVDSPDEFDKTPPLSVFAHADPVGTPEYNSILSARRARAVYGMLIRDADIWDDLFTHAHPMGGDVWGKAALQTVVDFNNSQPGGGGPDADSEATVKAAQTDKGLRKQLFLTYMNLVCVKRKGDKEEPFVLQKRNFLGRGADPNGKGDLQGCGEFNPTLILSKEQLRAFEKARDEAGRNAANERNRRVLVFLFKPASKIDPKKWPCPDVKDRNPGAACRKRFWGGQLDGDQRIKEDEREEKEFKRGRFQRKTFACRFYQGIAQDSPCEGIHKQWVIRVLLDVPREDLNPPREPTPLANKRFLVQMSEAAEAPRIRGRTDSDGVIRLPVFDEKATMTLKLEVGDILLPEGVTREPEKGDASKEAAAETSKDEDKFMTFTLKAGDLLKTDEGDQESRDLAVKQRLYNLGYGLDELEKWDQATFTQAVKAFQKHHNLSKRDGTLDDETRDKVKEVHQALPKKAEAPAGG